MTFQTVVNQQPAPGVPGDFASANPFASLLSGEGKNVAGSGGVVIGRFAWVDANGVVTNAGSGVPSGFVHNNHTAQIVTFLAEAGMTIQQGQPVNLMTAGDFWAQTSTAATPGQKIFASNTTGAIQTGAAGATIAGYTETKWAVPAGFSCAAGELVQLSTWV